MNRLHLLVLRELLLSDTTTTFGLAENHRLILGFRVYLRFLLQLLHRLSIDGKVVVTLLNQRWVGGFVDHHHRFLLGDEVLLEKEFLIEGLVLLDQIVEPAALGSLSRQRWLIFNGRVALLLSMVIIVKDGGSHTVVVLVAVFVSISPPTVMGV